MEAGPNSRIDQLAAAEKINSSCVSRQLRLALMAPNIVAEILNGRQPEGMTRPRLMEPFPVAWRLQREVLAPRPKAARRSLTLGAVETPQLLSPSTWEKDT